MRNYDQNERLEYILKVIEKEKIRFPVADFVERFKINAGYASSMLNKKNNVSDKFWDKFITAFPFKESQVVPLTLIQQATIDILFSEVARINSELFDESEAQAFLSLEEKKNALIEKMKNEGFENA